MDNFDYKSYLRSGKIHGDKSMLTESEQVSEKKKQGYDDREDESLGARKGAEKGKKQSMKDRRDDSYGKFGKRDAEKKGKNKINKEGLEEDARTDAEQEGYKDGFNDAKSDMKDAMSKMKVSELKAKIREDILSTLNEADKEEEEEVKEALDMTASPETLRKMIFQLLDDGRIQSETADDLLNAISNSPSKDIYEEEEVDVDIDVEDEVEVDAEADDIEIERKGVKAKVEVGLSPEEEIVQDSLKAAMDAAQALGSDKLADQIGNTITFFTRQFVVGDNTD